MPKVIKKRPARKQRPLKETEDEVKSAALHTLDVMKARQRQIAMITAAIVVVLVIAVVYRFYSASNARRAHALENEAYATYTDTSGTMTDDEKWQKAAEQFRQSLDVKETPTAMFYVGNSLFNMGDYSGAIEVYERYLNRFGSSGNIPPLVFQKLAAAHFRGSEPEKGLAALERLEAVSGGIFRDTALVLQARYLESAGEKEKALEKYAELSSEYIDSPWSAEARAKLPREPVEGSADMDIDPEAEGFLDIPLPEDLIPEATESQ